MNSGVPGETKTETRTSPKASSNENGGLPGQEGMSRHQKTVRFLVHAPDASQVHLVGDFNSWNRRSHSLMKKDRGLWEAVIQLSPGRYKYKFIIDGEWVYRVPGAVQIERTCVQDIPAAEHVPNPFGSVDCLLIVH